jgi:hypothetical protein
MKTLARQRDKAEIIRRLKTLHPDSTRQWGRMSVHQMVCHLSDSFLVVTGQKAVSHSTTLLQRTVVKWLALYLPLPWPAGIPTRPEIDQELGRTRPVDFVQDVAQLEALVESITTQTSSFGSELHPIFGRMSGRAWLRWGYLHVDHHLRQFGA